MVFLYKRFGDKSNRLIQNIHFEAYCKHNNIEYHNLEFYDMEYIYGLKDKYSFRNIPKIILPPINARYNIVESVSKFCKRFNNFLIYDYMNVNDQENIDLYDSQILKNKDKIVFVSGWNFRVTKLVYKYVDYFREKYKPVNLTSKEYLSVIDKFKDYDIKIGVHIRRGDYRFWNDGKYYYEDEVYLDKMEQFCKLFPNKEILFILFSNEEITLKPNGDFIVSKCSWFEDHHLLSLCDYIIGAPSTFNLWGSFMGGVPLMWIMNVNDKVDKIRFNVDISITPCIE